jgi:hypothetical protein
MYLSCFYQFVNFSVIFLNKIFKIQKSLNRLRLVGNSVPNPRPALLPNLNIIQNGQIEFIKYETLNMRLQ